MSRVIALISFAIKVYVATRAIPVGETLTCGAVALQIGDKQLARNVGKALRRNPLPIIVPCHGVIGANDKLTGFSANGGVKTKLRISGCSRSRARGLAKRRACSLISRLRGSRGGDASPI